MDGLYSGTYTCAVTNGDQNEYENHKSQKYEVHTKGWRAMCDYIKPRPKFISIIIEKFKSSSLFNPHAAEFSNLK